MSFGAARSRKKVFVVLISSLPDDMGSSSRKMEIKRELEAHVFAAIHRTCPELVEATVDLAESFLLQLDSQKECTELVSGLKKQSWKQKVLRKQGKGKARPTTVTGKYKAESFELMPAEVEARFGGAVSSALLSPTTASAPEDEPRHALPRVPSSRWESDSRSYYDEFQTAPVGSLTLSHLESWLSGSPDLSGCGLDVDGEENVDAGTLLGMLEFITNALTASRAQALKSAYDRGEFTGELLSGDRLLRTIAGPPISASGGERMPAMLSLSPSVSSQSGLFLRSGRDGLYPPHPDILCREGFVLKQRWFVNKSCSISNGLHSTVYRAWDLHNGCDVVVKIMKSHAAGEQESHFLRQLGLESKAPNVFDYFPLWKTDSLSSVSSASGGSPMASPPPSGRKPRNRRPKSDASPTTTSEALLSRQSSAPPAVDSGTIVFDAVIRESVANIDDYCFSPLGPAVDVTRRGILPDNEPLLDYVIVMEWAERGSLERVTYQDENELFNDAKQVIECAIALHRHSYVHCDLKPQNLLKCASGVKLIDFSTLVKEGSVMTTLVGTPEYIAPEISRHPVLGGMLSTPRQFPAIHSGDTGMPSFDLGAAAASPSSPVPRPRAPSDSDMGLSDGPFTVSYALDAWGVGATLHYMFTREAVWKKSSRADVNECRLSFQQCTCALPSGDGSVMGSPTLRPTPSGDSYRCGDSVNGSSIAGNSIRTRATAVTAQGGSRGADGSPVAVLKSLEQAHRHVQRTLEPAVRAQKSPALCSRCRHLKPIFYDLLHRYLLKLDPAARSPLEETLKSSFFNHKRGLTVARTLVEVLALFSDPSASRLLKNGQTTMNLIEELTVMQNRIPKELREVHPVARFPDSVEDAFRRTTPRFLQFSCHGGVNLAIGKGLELAPDATAEFTPSEVSDKTVGETGSGLLGGDLLFEDRHGRLVPVHAGNLAPILMRSPNTGKHRLECIFLNGCNTYGTAIGLLSYPGLTKMFKRIKMVGWKTLVINQAAVKFTTGFYSAFDRDVSTVTVERAYLTAVESMSSAYPLGELQSGTGKLSKKLTRFGLPFIAQRCRCRVSSIEGRACVCFAQLPEVVRSTYGKLVDRVPVPAREEPDGDSAYNIVVVWYDKRA